MPIFTYFTLIITMFLWAGTFIAGRMLAETLQPCSAAFLRFFIASLVMLLLVTLAEKKLTIPPKKLWFPLFLLGLTGVFAYNVLFFSGLHHISAGRASLIIALNPLVITICAALFLGERLTLFKAIGICISLGGAIVVISKGHPTLLFNGGFGPGERALLGCVASWSAYSLIGRSVLTRISPLTAVCYSSIIGTILLFFPAAQEGLLGQLTSISIPDWISLGYLGIGGTALGFSMYYQAIKKIGAARSGVFINLVPLFSIMLSWLILDEAVKPIVLVGGILVLSGVSLTNYQRSNKLSA